MNEYFEIVADEDRFNEIKQIQKNDDNALSMFLDNLVKTDNHKKFNFSLLNIGTLLQTISVFFEFKKKEMHSALNLEKEKIRDRRMREIVREMNEKINLRYELDEDTSIVKKIYMYEGQTYILVDKFMFINLLSDSIDETNLSQL